MLLQKIRLINKASCSAWCEVKNVKCADFSSQERGSRVWAQIPNPKCSPKYKAQSQSQSPKPEAKA
jgi:hypothetical protein